MSNTIEIVIATRDAFSRGLSEAKSQLDGFGSKAQQVGRSITGVGVGLALAFAPAVAGLADFTRTAVEFDTALTNIRSLTGETTAEFAGMKDQLLELGSDSIAGPQAVSEAMYDIVSGVSDASTHMAILEASIATSEAGAASLTGTTAALVSVMNAYKFSAGRATYVSNVLTRTVGVGVGTMEEFAAAIPTVTGVAAQVGAEFDDVGSQLAYLTTQGYTAAVAATQIRQAFVALLTPNAAMKDQLEAIGFESGSAALEALGLVETYRRLNEASGGSVDAMALATGSVEALQAALALTTEEFAGFDAAFEAGVDGATQSAQEIQRSGAAAQFATLSSEVETLKIRVGDALVPALIELTKEIKPVIGEITDWVAENPELVAQIAQLIIGGLVLGGGLAILGGIISSVGTVVGILSGAIKLLTGGALIPLLPILLAGAVLFAAYELNILGFRDTVDKAFKSVEQLVFILDALRGKLGDQAQEAALAAITNQVNPNDTRPGLRWDASRRQWIDASTGMPSITQYPPPGGRAFGGMVSPSNPYMVGERGPEMFIPASAGRIMPNNALGGGGDTYQISVMLPEAALANPGRAQSLGETFGDAIVRRLREQG